VVLTAHFSSYRTRTVQLVPYMCALCENPLDPVTPETGVIRSLNVGMGLEVPVYMHLRCVEKWERKTGLKTD
jgi:hypothetical protein